MSAFSFHRPRFLRSRARSPKPLPADACDGAPVVSLDLGPSRPSPSPLFSRQDVDAATSPSHLLVPGKSAHQISTARSPLNRAPVDFGSQPSSASRPVTPSVPTLGSHDSVFLQDIQLAPPSDHTRSIQAQQYLAPPPSFATPSQQSFYSEHPILPAGQDSPLWHYKKLGMFDRAHDFSMTGPTFIDGNIAVTNNVNTASSQFMKDLLKETISGAASDSSARYPPPRCHPGTRLAVLERCLYFIAHCNGEKQMRWVFGAAGVGKSAIMQSVADSPNLPVTCHVSVFFSINGRDDGSKAILTLSYQFAAKSAVYRQLIESEIACDPSLLQSSLPVQFKRFIIGPFIHNPQLSSAGRILIIIDGLDECKNARTQQELLRLISDFCIEYPSSPLIWLIASRPERHITSFFARANVIPAYEKEEIEVDSDEGRADVERFLRAELNGIKEASYSLGPHSEWPEEKDLWELANASGGLFAYADTVIRYIGDLNVGNPVSQLSVVLKVIDNHPMTGIPREEHPMALLDALYARILSNVPDKVIIHTRKLVLALASDWSRFFFGEKTFVILCNWLAMTPDEAYAAVNQLQSLLRTPRREQAHREMLEPFHKSFLDYVSDSFRSDFFPDIHYEAQQLKTGCTFRVLNEAPDGIDFGDLSYNFTYGILRRGPGTGDTISLTWPVDGYDKYTRLNLYKLAVGEVVKGLRNRDPTFTSEFCIRLLATRFQMHRGLNYDIFREVVFDESRRHEFMRCGILKQMPLKAIPGIHVLFRSITLWFHHPTRVVAPGVSTVVNTVELPSHLLARSVTNSSDPWNPSCRHEREGEWEEGKDKDWKTTFYPDNCNSCYQRFGSHLKSWKTHSPDHTVPVLFTSTGECCVEFRFVDPDDGISEWTYWYWIELSLEERKKYGSAV